MEENIQFELNGKQVQLVIDPGLKLLWVLRNRFGLTGAKYGCGMGVCSACTVVIDNVASPSCVLTIGSVKGKKILTIEGLAHNGELHPLQAQFMEHDAMQCGYCTSGMIMRAHGLLLKNPKPTRQDILQGMEPNLCRCGAHVRIIDAVESAANVINGGK
jgi:aerobic-type carbon monoxide dehydrogenase small subunit (CoxS/CutS family)